MERNVIHLVLKKKWFDMIFSGEKKEEYREGKEYWLKRFTQKGKGGELEFRKIDRIVFHHGYRRDRRTFECEFKGFAVGTGHKEWGAKSGVVYYVLKLGKIVSSNFN